jgi:UDP-N-acetyl-2-amino-2-deoxyglucuronate dehydrogenase
MEKETGKNIYTILQLRLHPAIIALKEKIDAAPADKKYDIKLEYITSRGHWYHTSWKGDLQKSGGIATNIGVHFFDMLMWIFGSVKENNVIQHTVDTASGNLVLQKANINWMLSINANTLPAAIQAAGKRTYRILSIDGEAFEFSDGFTELHTKSYQQIINGNGFGIGQTKAAIQLVHDIRNAK